MADQLSRVFAALADPTRRDPRCLRHRRPAHARPPRAPDLDARWVGPDGMDTRVDRFSATDHLEC